MKMKKLLKNAVVYAVAVSMLVATPLTASAGLRDVYKVTDGSGNVVSGDPEEPTGTITNTFSDTGTGVLQDNDARIVDIVLDQDYVNLTVDPKDPELTTTVQLTATVLVENDIEVSLGKDEKGEPKKVKLSEAVSRFIRWETDNNDDWKIGIKVDDALNRSIVTLTPKKGTKLGDEVVVKASIGGDASYANFTRPDGRKVEIEGYEKEYSAEAKVYVKEYSSKLAFTQAAKDLENKAYVKHTLNLNDALYLDRGSATANDDITWTTSNKQIATVTAAGVVTFKKGTNANPGKVTITAASEKGYVAKCDFKVTEGNPATKIAITKVDPAAVSKNANNTSGEVDLGANGGDDKNKEDKFDVTLTATVTTSDGAKTTDFVEWTSNKPDIVKIVTSERSVNDKNEVTAKLRPLSVGTAKITATTSTKRKVTFTLKVKATLVEITGITVDGIEYKPGATTSKYYSGQVLQLGTVKNPKANKDAVQWKVDNTQIASIDGKGVLKIKPNLKGNNKIVVTATPKQKDIKGEKPPKQITIAVEQSYVKEITVRDSIVVKDPNGKDVPDPIAQVKIENDGKKVHQYNKGKTDYMSLPKGRTFTASVESGNTTGAASLNWKTNNAKIASITGNGESVTITALKKGTATITVSGVYAKNGKPENPTAFSATFKVKVTQPATKLTMQKTLNIVKYSANRQGVANKKNVALKVTQNKGAADKVWWSVSGTGASVEKADKAANSKKVVLGAGAYSVGSQYVVTAKADSGVKATSRIKVVTPSTGLEVWDKVNGSKLSNNNKISLEYGADKGVSFVPMVKIGNGTDAKYYKAGTSEKDLEVANVTYTVNKKGVVSIIGNKIYRVGDGSAVITFKTEDGKTYKLTILNNN